MSFCSLQSRDWLLLKWAAATEMPEEPAKYRRLMFGGFNQMNFRDGMTGFFAENLDSNEQLELAGLRPYNPRRLSDFTEV